MRDAYGSVVTIESSVVGGANRQVVTTSLGNSSVMLLNSSAVIGSVAVLQGTNPWVVGSVSGTVGSSIFGQLPAGTAVLGSIAALQGTALWNIAGSVAATITNTNLNVGGSVLSQQLGTRISSVVNSIPSSLLTGIHGHRNDAIASYLGGNLSWRPIATDSAGRTVTKPFSPEESRIEGYASTVNLNANSIIAAAATGLRNYITDVWVANTGASTTLVTFLSGGGLSVLGYTIAPTAGGSNLIGLATPIRTGAGETFDFRAATGTSVLYITAKGFTAP